MAKLTHGQSICFSNRGENKCSFSRIELEPQARTLLLLIAMVIFLQSKLKEMEKFVMGILSKRNELRMYPEAFLIAIFHLFSFNLFKPTNLWVFFKIMH